MIKQKKGKALADIHRLRLALFLCILVIHYMGVDFDLAVYVCTNRKCRFVFERTSTVDACEDCGSANIRNATDEEVREYRDSCINIDNKEE